jgi:hypothetical protein
VNSVEQLPPVEVDLPERALVAMGGGKDSLVSLELLRNAQLAVQPVCVGASELIGNTVKAAGLPLIRIERELSPALKEMNEAGALNGHVPVTAINSAILLCASLLYGYRWIVLSNESSADEATLTNDAGQPVNHQYSKGLEFEKNFRAIIEQQVSTGIEYFSLLRPFKEITIARRFAGLSKYHEVFSSCNRNFHLDGSRIEGRWCGLCPKCRFTSLVLAPFLSPDELTAILGKNLLADPGQEEGFRALCQLGVEKPFECVGTVGESRSSIMKLSEIEQWREMVIVKALSEDIDSREALPFEELLNARGEHCIPQELVQHAAL